jgi:NAD(P)H-nitrite reductase large subunit
MLDDVLICNCNEIYKNTIVKAIKDKGLKTVEKVGEETTAGTICGHCEKNSSLLHDYDKPL